MTDRRIRQNVERGNGDRVVFAEVVTSDHPHGTAEAIVHAKSGHIPPGTRRDLIDAVLDLPEIRHCDHLLATIPLGDAESLLRLDERCDCMTVRAAGSSALVEADLEG
jgi:hypothetical protein